MTLFARLTRLVAMVLATSAGLTACGLPSDGRVEKVDDARVPYRLLEPGPVGSPADTQRGGSSAAEPQIFWLTKTGLAPAASDQSCSTDTYRVVQGLLRRLAAGPNEIERAAGASTTLTPDSRLTLVELSGRTAVVELQASAPLPADRLPLAIGQLVLTVTSAPRVDDVVLRDGRQHLQVPLPGGALTGDPVSTRDYAPLVRSRERRQIQAATSGCDSPTRSRGR